MTKLLSNLPEAPKRHIERVLEATNRLDVDLLKKRIVQNEHFMPSTNVKIFINVHKKPKLPLQSRRSQASTKTSCDSSTLILGRAFRYGSDGE